MTEDINESQVSNGDTDYEFKALTLLDKISKSFKETSILAEQPYKFGFYENIRSFTDGITTTYEFNTCEVYKKVLSIFETDIYHSVQRKSIPRHEIDMEEDEQANALNPEKLTYLLMMIEMLDSSQFRNEEGKKAFNMGFINKLMSMLYSEDITEREHLKTILHRVYGRFLNFRSKIRLRMKYIFQEVYTLNENCPGLGQILDLLTSIVNGYATPIKEEHKLFLKESLIPLIKLPNIIQFENKLKSTLFVYSFKDAECLMIIFNAILKYWPNIPNKCIIFLSWIREFLDLIPEEYYGEIRVRLLRCLNKCFTTEHSLLNENSLSLLLSSPIVSSPIMKIIAIDPKSSLKIMFKDLKVINESNWNGQVYALQKELDSVLKEVFKTSYYEVFEELKNDPSQAQQIRSWQLAFEKFTNQDDSDESIQYEEMEVEN